MPTHGNGTGAPADPAFGLVKTPLTAARCVVNAVTNPEATSSGVLARIAVYINGATGGPGNKTGFVPDTHVGGGTGEKVFPVQYNTSPDAAGIHTAGVGFLPFNFLPNLKDALNPSITGFADPPINVAPGTNIGIAVLTA